MHVELDLQLASEASELPSEAQLRQWCELALRQRSADSEMTIRLVDEAEGRERNHTYRHKDYATNVLSFPYDTEPLVMGDLVICPSVVAREAAEQNKPLDAHYAHLTVHGMLHLQGWDHEEDDEAQAMEDTEREILAALGYPDPYADDRAA